MVRLLTLYLAAGIEVGVVVIVGFAAGEAIFRAGWSLKNRQAAASTGEIRLRFARWLALAIEFEPAADIIRVIRTALNFFLGREAQGSERRLETAAAAPLRAVAP